MNDAILDPVSLLVVQVWPFPGHHGRDRDLPDSVLVEVHMAALLNLTFDLLSVKSTAQERASHGADGEGPQRVTLEPSADQVQCHCPVRKGGVHSCFSALCKICCAHEHMLFWLLKCSVLDREVVR